MTLSAELLPGIPLVESPLFYASLDAMNLAPFERDIAISLHENGYAVLDFPDPDIDARIARIKSNLGPHYNIDLNDPNSIKAQGDNRIQDAWQFDTDVKAIATNAGIIDLLTRLYGRPAFPFQTLNFPVGTQQHFHSDSVHFSSQPERFMCGVWLAMEDVSADAGPLEYRPGTHKWPILSNVMMGRSNVSSALKSAQEPHEAVWHAMVQASGIEAETFLARKGQALIWAANLIHGGSVQNDRTLTRWSQVTHYYFADCIYYTPAYSIEPLGDLHTRHMVDISNGKIMPNQLMGKVLSNPEPPHKPWHKRLKMRLTGQDDTSTPIDLTNLPDDFDSATYLRLNPDVANHGNNPTRHYLKHGRREGRRYKD
jgi:Phytanoyl-CoA dioxygenase (PhyH)